MAVHVGQNCDVNDIISAQESLLVAVSGEEVKERSCDSLVMCIVTTLNQGLRNGGGIGDILRAPSSAVSSCCEYEVNKIVRCCYCINQHLDQTVINTGISVVVSVMSVKLLWLSSVIHIFVLRPQLQTHTHSKMLLSNSDTLLSMYIIFLFIFYL